MNEMALAVLFLSMLVLLLAALPIAVALGLGAGLTMMIYGLAPLELGTQLMISSVDSWILLAVPMFILTGALIAESSIGQRLVDLFNALFAWMPGGLAISAVFTCFLFGGLTGSAAAETAGVTSIMGRPMERAGYPRAFVASLIAAAGTNANLVPPSIALLIYGIIAQVSIADLFVAGVLPGLLFAVLLAAPAAAVAARRGYGRAAAVARLPLGVAFRRAGWALLAPVLILGGIRFGIFTPTESAFFITLYAFVVGKFVYRDFTWTQVPRIVERAGITTIAVMFILATSSLFAWLVTVLGLPTIVESWFRGAALSYTETVLLLVLVLTVAGTFLEPVPILLILVPVLLPVARGIDMNMVQFGIFVTVGINLALITPPVGMTLYVGAKVANASVWQTSIESLPWCLVFVVLFLLVGFVPAISLVFL
jgi:C4-dicarboxylate transporter DctM subunit